MQLRIGIGNDLHCLVEGRPLFLGGLEIPYRLGLLGHSDGDAAVHALIDALLGAAGLGDIGKHFPDTDPQYAGISSLRLLEKTAELIRQNGFSVVNLDGIIMAQRPKLNPLFPEMQKKLAEALGISPQQINLKAKTGEEVGEIGRGEAVSALFVALLNKAE